MNQEAIAIAKRIEDITWEAFSVGLERHEANPTQFSDNLVDELHKRFVEAQFSRRLAEGDPDAWAVKNRYELRGVLGI